MTNALAGSDPCVEQQAPTRKVDPDLIGFAASGGGYRATLVHVGALWRLNQMGWLRKIHRFSGVSGGSIALGRLAACWTQLVWDGDEATNFLDLVAFPLIAFTRRRLDLLAIVSRLLPSRGDYIEQAYRAELVGDLLLKDLPEHPQFTFNATAPTVTTLSVSSGPTAGGTTVVFISR